METIIGQYRVEGLIDLSGYVNTLEHNDLLSRDSIANHNKIIPSGDSTSAIQLMRYNGTDTVLDIDTVNSRVGIGTITPSYRLDISRSVQDQEPILRLRNTEFESASVKLRLECESTYIDIFQQADGNEFYMIMSDPGIIHFHDGVAETSIMNGKIQGLKFAWGMIATIETVAVGTVLSASHYTVLCNSASALAITLPEASSHSGRVYNIKNINTGVVTIGRTGTNTIDGATSYAISTRYDSVTVQSDGSNWYII